MPTCRAPRKDGNPCTAQAQAGREYCFFHDPDKADEAKAAQVKGGTVGQRATLDPMAVKPWRGQNGAITVLQAPTVGDLLNLLSDTVDEVRTGRIDPKVANAVGYLTGIMLKCLQYDLLEERLSALEEAVGAKVRP